MTWGEIVFWVSRPRFCRGLLLCYVFLMSQTTDKLARVMPSATPTEAELEAWAALPRDEQVLRYQQMFRHPDCNTFTTDTPEDILAAARRQVAARLQG